MSFRTLFSNEWENIYDREGENIKFFLYKANFGEE